MPKTEVYSWRVSSETKMALELEARRKGVSLAELLDGLARQWLAGRRDSEESEQKRLRAAVAATIGSIAGRNPRRAESARTTIRKRLSQQYGARRAD